MTTIVNTSVKRIASVDVLRGITLALIILVNTAGEWPHAYWPLKHADWNGWTPTDLVFPTFLFLTGTSLVFSFRSRLNRGASRSSLMLHTLQRAAVLFFIGVFLNELPFFSLGTCASTVFYSELHSAISVQAPSIYGTASPPFWRPRLLFCYWAIGS